MCRARSSIRSSHSCNIRRYQVDKSEVFLLVEADNVFNSIDRKAVLHKVSATCPLIVTFIGNDHMEPARLFVAENHKIKSRVGAT